ncbi:MAG TPA: hypothetical protein VGL22_03190 [Terracidiphilus sp.]
MLIVALGAAGLLGAGPAMLNEPMVYAQGASALPALRSFAGTWNLMFEEKHFATMILKEQDGRLTGSLTNESLGMNEEGRITRADARTGTSPVVRTVLEGQVLHIVEKDGADEIEWAMTLKSETRATLKIEGAGAPANAQPIELERVWSEPPVQP